MNKSMTTAQTIRYTDQGEGEVIVLVNGLSRTSRHWLGFDRALAQSFRVITFDLRGVGTSNQACTWQTRVEDMAQDLIQLLDQLAIAKAHIFGVSLGGMVALACGIHHPTRCLSLTLVNSSVGNHPLSDKRLTRHALLFMLRSAFMKPTQLPHARLLSDLVLSRDTSASRRLIIAQNLVQLELEQATDPSQVMKQAFAALRFRPGPQLGTMKVPTLIIRGSDDRFVPPENSDTIAKQLAHATCWTIEGGGHEVTMDRCDEVLKVQVEWIKRLARAEGVPA